MEGICAYFIVSILLNLNQFYCLFKSNSKDQPFKNKYMGFNVYNMMYM